MTLNRQPRRSPSSMMSVIGSGAGLATCSVSRSPEELRSNGRFFARSAIAMLNLREWTFTAPFLINDTRT